MNGPDRVKATHRNPAGQLALRLLAVCLAMIAAAGCGQHDETSTDLDDPRRWGDYEYDGQPAIEAPERVAFDDVPEGETAREEFAVENAGRHLLEFEEWSIDGPFEMEFLHQDGEAPKVIAPDEEVLVRVSHTGGSNGEPIEGALTIESNDPDKPEATVQLLANADLPCLEMTPEERLDFGVRQRDERQRENVTLTNCAEESPLEVDVGELRGDEAFALGDGDSRREFEIEAGQSVELPIVFTPEEPATYTGSLTIESSADEDPERTVELRGEGSPYECPEPVIRATHPERGEVIADPRGRMEAVPLDDIELDASLSEDPEGEGIASYEWELVERPADSNVELENTDGEQNELWMELAGTYEIELQVESELGIEGCDAARLTLESVAESDIHVQLVWSTPSDPDEADDFGTDVDIHLLHPNGAGAWDREPWDCHWKNPNPDWGDSDREDDDPSLDIDDTDGAGPENINLDYPEDVDYEVGVHYFNANDFGESFATVRIYLEGQLIHEAEDQRMTDREFWHAATIDWEAHEVEAHDRIYNNFP